MIAEATEIEALQAELIASAAPDLNAFARRYNNAAWKGFRILRKRTPLPTESDQKDREQATAIRELVPEAPSLTAYVQGLAPLG